MKYLSRLRIPRLECVDFAGGLNALGYNALRQKMRAINGGFLNVEGITSTLFVSYCPKLNNLKSLRRLTMRLEIIRSETIILRYSCRSYSMHVPKAYLGITPTPEA